MADKNTQPIIIKRKKGHGHGAHGGAWKVAYADFVTAMMAFFMVMWLLGSDEETKSAVENYFNNPTSALRVDLSSKDTLPLGDKTGAGDSVLRGADGEVPEELVKTPSRPIMDGNTKAEDPADVAMRIASSGDKFIVEVMKFSVLEKDLFKPGSSDEFLGDAVKILTKVGKLSHNQKFGKVQIKGSVGDDTGSYEFQVSRVVAIAKFLVERKFVEEEKLATSVVKKRQDNDRGIASSSEPRIEFNFTTN